MSSSSPDVNLLLYTTVTGFPQHERARAWWEDVLNGSTTVGLTPPALFGYLRITTSSRVLSSPMTVAGAVERVQDWLAQPVVAFTRPGPRHLDIALELLRTLGTGVNPTTDVQLAAHAIEQDADLCSSDSDFVRLPGVRWTDPLRERTRPRGCSRDRPTGDVPPGCRPPRHSSPSSW